jgi:ubiquinone/menaquinone biosynthesis C-methylase UbiE
VVRGLSRAGRMSDPGLDREFDQIAPAYDATRSPLDPTALEGIAGRILSSSTPTVLDVGVGTGRVALPLTERGVAVTGVDWSFPMLARAAAKGLRGLARADAASLPFANGSFDFVLFVHVLNLLPDPFAALLEARRVARTGVLTVREEYVRLDVGGIDKEAVRSAVREELRGMGFRPPMPQVRAGLEDNLLRTVPPCVARSSATQRWSTPPRNGSTISAWVPTGRSSASRMGAVLRRSGAWQHVLTAPRPTSEGA